MAGLLAFRLCLIFTSQKMMSNSANIQLIFAICLLDSISSFILGTLAQRNTDQDNYVTYKQCGGYLQEAQAVVMSPNYPENEDQIDNVYPENQDCEWRKSEMLESTLYRVKFWDMALENRPLVSDSNITKCYDYVNITILSIETKQFCRWQAPEEIIEGVGKDLLIHFHSDESENYRGFMLSYKTISDFAPCSSNPCNQGNCELTSDNLGYKCVCFEGYTDLNECESNPCRNGGTCRELRLSGFSCLCPDSWHGALCDYDINPCSSNPCNEWSICEEAEPYQYKCLCMDGFTGEKCDEEVDECSSNPCSNNGTCIDFFNSFTCICSSGWTGKRCDYLDNSSKCSEKPCKDYEICEVLGNEKGYRCLCSPENKGANCKDSINSCEYNSCLNGGTCIGASKSKWYKCNCRNGYSGHICEVVIYLGPPQCGNPGIPYLSKDFHWTSGSTLKFYCTEGYRLLGVENLTCMKNNTWTNDMPLCIADVHNSLSSLLLTRGASQVVFLVVLCIACFVLITFCIWLFMKGPWQFGYHFTKVVKIND
ncbi:uncharacterized protein LOC143449923 isoform X3 [Clavelina lepadiformis]|uniref:uncharacterized protein LOC143449923 isoform X3 n=1 Tax=Clavelina lepadiformis TaxID=159417 RepID=UPI0040424815